MHNFNFLSLRPPLHRRPPALRRATCPPAAMCPPWLRPRRRALPRRRGPLPARRSPQAHPSPSASWSTTATRATAARTTWLTEPPPAPTPTFRSSTRRRRGTAAAPRCQPRSPTPHTRPLSPAREPATPPRPTRPRPPNLSQEMHAIFDLISKFKPASIPIPPVLRPFVPEFIPAIGDIDEFIKARPRPQPARPQTHSARTPARAAPTARGGGLGRTGASPGRTARLPGPEVAGRAGGGAERPQRADDDAALRRADCGWTVQHAGADAPHPPAAWRQRRGAERSLAA